MKKSVIFGALALVFGIAVVLILVKGGWNNEEGAPSGDNSSPEVSAVVPTSSTNVPDTGKTRSATGTVRTKNDSTAKKTSSGMQKSPFIEPEVPDEEKIVESFDALTDKWIKPVKGGVPMSEVDRFRSEFKKLPASRRRECLQRALNLVPDENVMVLAGVLFDKTLDKDTVTMVFQDVLNRGEEVKKPILQEIFKDRSHPCWADVAWILDVTGEIPKVK